ncbi:E3 ubiquitin-protein ligase ATL6-like protein [Cinnamomum micranthum f. kanehirae]|uniref:RING-type E3 ubiquitin transferase n=1 Tax=Cinnamomum micranthum f. kanehirae TaxID=337451 RepID=A0A3S3N7X1_9MAGN|nr:E3 ubiquitin-protein ligase ATL6-like protein [Cinnamomum micranthum f. kanehirae]
MSIFPSLLFLLLQLLLANAQPSAGSEPSRHDPRRFSASMAIILVVLVSSFCLMAFFSVYLRLCASDTRSAGSLRRSRTRATARRGVERAVIDAFPLFQYSAVKGLKLGSDALECAVCLNEFEGDDNLRLLPVCSHVFHPDCIDTWLSSHVTCPVCRSDLLAPAPDTNAPLSVPDTAVSEGESRDEMPLRQVAVDVSEEPSQDPEPDVTNPDHAPLPKPIRSKSVKGPLRFPRSHTTGHSLVPPGEDVERFTLRLPEHVRKEIVDGNLNRSASCAAFRSGGRSVSGGSCQPRVEKIEEESGGRGRFPWRFNRAARSDRWTFLTPPLFFSRTCSVRAQGSGDGELTAKRKGVMTSVKTPLDCLGSKTEAGKQVAGSGSGSDPGFTVSVE